MWNKLSKIWLIEGFHLHQECAQIPIQFSVLVLFSLYWKNDSTINRFHNVTPNRLKPSRCTPIHWELYESTKSMAWSALIWEIFVWQNKLPCFIARWVCQGGLQCFFELQRQRNNKEKNTKRITKCLKKKSLNIPHFQTNILFIFLMFQMINKLWVRQLKLYKNSLNYTDNISISKD